MFFPVYLLLSFRNTPLYTFVFRIFDISPTSGSAFSDLAMTEMRAGTEASWE